MIYFKAESVEDVAKIFHEYENPIVYSGGTEIVTMIRSGKISPAALIDLKGIPEYVGFQEETDSYILGGGITLNTVSEKLDIPLLSEVAGKVADHTVRNALTLAGNICGRLPYREVAVPLLLLNASVEIIGKEGRRIEKINDIFDRRIFLNPDEFIMSFRIEKQDIQYRSIRRTEGTTIDYPIVHMMGIKSESSIAIGCSGLHPFPYIFKGDEFDIEYPIISDQRASKAYREHLARMDFDSVRGDLL